MTFSVRPSAQPLYVPVDAFPPDSVWGAEMRLDAARAYLAAAVRAQDPDRHFKALPESPEVIAAYDQVRAAEKAVAKGRRA